MHCLERDVCVQYWQVGELDFQMHTRAEVCVHYSKSNRGPSILNYILCLLASIIITPISSFICLYICNNNNEKVTMNLKRGVDLRSWRKRKEKMM